MEEKVYNLKIMAGKPTQKRWESNIEIHLKIGVKMRCLLELRVDIIGEPL